MITNSDSTGAPKPTNGTSLREDRRAQRMPTRQDAAMNRQNGTGSRREAAPARKRTSPLPKARSIIRQDLPCLILQYARRRTENRRSRARLKARRVKVTRNPPVRKEKASEHRTKAVTDGTDTLRSLKSETLIAAASRVGSNMRYHPSISVLDGFREGLVLVYAPLVEHSVLVEVHHGDGFRREGGLVGIIDGDYVIGRAAVCDKLLLLEPELLEGRGVFGVCIEVALLKGMDERQLLLRFDGLGLGDEGHEVGQGDCREYAEDCESNEEVLQRKSFQVFHKAAIFMCVR